jgi:hypothetical protein
MHAVKRELKLTGVYVVSKETGTIELFDPEKHLETLAHIYAAYITIHTGITHRVIRDDRDIDLNDEVLTAAKVAKILGVSPPTAYAIMRQTDFPMINISGDGKGGNKRVLRSDLMKWLRDRRV